MPTPADFLSDILPYMEKCPGALAERAVLHTVREFCEFSGYWTEDLLLSSVTDETSPGVYALVPTDTGAEILSVKTPIFHNERPSLLKTPEWLEENYRNGWRTATGTFAKYFTMPAKTTLQLVPYPTDAGVGDIRVPVLLRPAMVSPFIGQVILDEFIEQISWGARARLKNDPAATWYDKASAAELNGRFEAAKERAKSLALAMGQDRRHQSKRTTVGSYF